MIMYAFYFAEICIYKQMKGKISYKSTENYYEKD